jgi:UDP-N-acetylglucosamine--N-acetylmuramyl-(pentapeptide) pyrophosphoryl-undecaprenol N-acetylglucosamine transferase
LPAVLVPYPHAWRYQRTNAEYLAARGGGRLLLDEELSEKLAPIVLNLIGDRNRRAEMRIAMRNLYRPSAAEEIGDLIVAAASSGRSERKA